MTFYDDELRPLELDDLVEAAEANPLLRRVDALCDARAWDELVELARRCREAYERGKQLWPIAEHIDYRLALEAPPRYAAAVRPPTAARVAAWVTASGGRAEAVVVDVPAEAAIGALGVGPFMSGEIGPRLARALMGWAAASGGAHRRRRVAAAGRSAAWWVATELSDVD